MRSECDDDLQLKMQISHWVKMSKSVFKGLKIDQETNGFGKKPVRQAIRIFGATKLRVPGRYLARRSTRKPKSSIFRLPTNRSISRTSLPRSIISSRQKKVVCPRSFPAMNFMLENTQNRVVQLIKTVCFVHNEIWKVKGGFQTV